MSSSALFVCLWFVYATACIRAYYLSPNHLPFDQAQQFCHEICHSNLATVVDDEQRNALEHSINSRRNARWSTLQESAWIGLMRSPSSMSPWTWMDGTNTTSVEVDAYPWSVDALQWYDTPHGNAAVAQYSSLNLSSFQLEIESVNDTSSALPFICNTCDGVIHKYAMIASGDCDSVFGTRLAVLSEDASFPQWQQLVALASDSVRIGMTVDDVHNLSTYRWLDGSRYEPVDSDPTQCVGACAPWVDQGPDGDGGCVHITRDGLWNTLPCDADAVVVVALDYQLCQMPSELDAVLNAWSVINGQFWFTSDGAVHTFDNGSNHNLAAMAGTYWYNGDANVSIEYALNVQFGADTRNEYAGIAIFNHASGGCFPHYYVLVLVDKNGQLYLALYRNTGVVSTSLAFVRLDFRWDDDEVYVLSMNLCRGNLFQLELNGNVVTFNDSRENSQVLPDASGYVGIVSSKGIDVRSQWLYVSGTAWSVDASASATATVDLVASCLSPVDATFPPAISPTSKSDILDGSYSNGSTSDRVGDGNQSTNGNETTTKPDSDIQVIVEVTKSKNSDDPIAQTSWLDTNTTADDDDDDEGDGDDDDDTDLSNADKPPSMSILRWLDFDSFGVIHYVVFSMAVVVLILVTVVCVLMCKNRKLRRFKKQSMQYVYAHEQHAPPEVHMEDDVGAGVGVDVLHHFSMKRARKSSLRKQCALSITNAVLCRQEEEEEKEELQQAERQQPTDSDDDMYEAAGTVPMDSDGDLGAGHDRLRIMRKQQRLATGATSNADGCSQCSEGQVSGHSQHAEEAHEEALQLMNKDASKSLLNGSPKYAMQSVADSDLDALCEEVPQSQRN